jgi:hypothetical protein
MVKNPLGSHDSPVKKSGCRCVFILLQTHRHQDAKPWLFTAG